SEAALNRARIQVEIQWLLFLADRRMFGVEPLSGGETAMLGAVLAEFGETEIAELAELEATTRHDVKAVEYFIRRRLDGFGLGRLAELTHFACTSEDINNLAYALTIRAAVHDVWLPRLRDVIARLRLMA